MYYQFSSGDEFLEILNNKTISEGSTLAFKHIKTHNEVGAISAGLQSENCPQNLKVFLWFDYLDDVDAQVLVNALQSGKCPQGLAINFKCVAAGNVAIQVLGDVILSGKCLVGLSINNFPQLTGYLTNKLASLVDLEDIASEASPAADKWSCRLNAIRGVLYVTPEVLWGYKLLATYTLLALQYYNVHVNNDSMQIVVDETIRETSGYDNMPDAKKLSKMLSNFMKNYSLAQTPFLSSNNNAARISYQENMANNDNLCVFPRNGGGL